MVKQQFFDTNCFSKKSQTITTKIMCLLNNPLVVVRLLQTLSLILTKQTNNYNKKNRVCNILEARKTFLKKKSEETRKL